MKRRLTWEQIREQFNGQWVMLTDVEWHWDSPYPSLARVYRHGDKREELVGSCRSDDSIILFITAIAPMVQVDQTLLTV